VLDELEDLVKNNKAEFSQVLKKPVRTWRRQKA